MAFEQHVLIPTNMLQNFGLHDNRYLHNDLRCDKKDDFWSE
jgi:hypothetical protein